ncbi:hypothetical protein BZA77DRAFT_319352 [Pyronema omphalodes]|nr:hypothetical protein BZA77DRAFT_319352 [Pyronema omphalodes]
MLGECPGGVDGCPGGAGALTERAVALVGVGLLMEVEAVALVGVGLFMEVEAVALVGVGLLMEVEAAESGVEMGDGGWGKGRAGRVALVWSIYLYLYLVLVLVLVLDW